MSLEEALEAEVSKDAAEREIRRHEMDPAEFFHEIGDRPWYTGAEVLYWLGY